eukprot:13400090-Alexandrium_andersonii.AAC.1
MVTTKQADGRAGGASPGGPGGGGQSTLGRRSVRPSIGGRTHLEAISGNGSQRPARPTGQGV